MYHQFVSITFFFKLEPPFFNVPGSFNTVYIEIFAVY